MKKKYTISIDQSTSSTKGFLFTTELHLVYKTSKEHRQHYPRAGWVEHDADEIYHNTIEVIRELIRYLVSVKGASFEIVCLSIANQRETIVVWDKETGMPVYPAIVWQCKRGEQRCAELINAGWKDKVKQKTGLHIDPYFSATGISWVLENTKRAKKKAEEGRLLFGTIDSWLIWKLTGGQAHATDYSNASRTMLFNIHTLAWDQELFDMLAIPMNMAPRVQSSNEVFGKTNLGGLLRTEIPITGVMGDSHAALFGQACFMPGTGKATFGTGSSIMFNIGAEPLPSPEGLVTSIGYAVNGKVAYVYEGNIHSTGATIAWLKDSLGLFRDVSETESMAKAVDSTDGVYLVPAFAGLGAPYWVSSARAAITGLTFATTKNHLVRAGLESIVYQVKDLLDLMIEKAGLDIRELKVDGGAVRNNFLISFLADMLCTTITKNKIEDAAAIGAAMAGGLGTGLWNDLEDLQNIDLQIVRISGCMDQESRDRLYSGWRAAVAKVLPDRTK